MKIAVIGSAPSSINLAPFQDASFAKFLGGMPPPQYPPAHHIEDEWEIWACSPGAWAQLQRCNRFFELHRWEPGQTWFSPQYCQFLREFRGIVYTGGVIEEIQNHVVYPIRRVEREFSSYFLHSSLSLMMAVAILTIMDKRAADPDHDATADSIGLWGVDMAANEEYGDQRSGCHFFILEALRRGIGIYVPPESCLLRPKPVYGLCEWDHAYIKATARSREFSARIQNAVETVKTNERQLAFLQGAADDMNYFINTWMSPYGIPAGTMVRHDPGTGLGGGITMRKPYTPTEPEGETGAEPIASGFIPAKLTPKNKKVWRRK